jgi:hypothetical protein
MRGDHPRIDRTNVAVVVVVAAAAASDFIVHPLDS